MHFDSDRSFVHPFSSFFQQSLEQSAVSSWHMTLDSSGFIKWWHRCLNLDESKASQSQRMCKAVADVCLHLPHLGMFTSPSLNKCPCKRQRSVSSSVNILSYSSDFSSYRAIPQLCLQSVFKKALSFAVAHAWIANSAYLSSPCSHTWKPLQIRQVFHLNKNGINYRQFKKNMLHAN
jgi:hypothetical protein